MLVRNNVRSGQRRDATYNERFLLTMEDTDMQTINSKIFKSKKGWNNLKKLK